MLAAVCLLFFGVICVLSGDTRTKLAFAAPSVFEQQEL